MRARRSGSGFIRVALIVTWFGSLPSFASTMDKINIVLSPLLAIALVGCLFYVFKLKKRLGEADASRLESERRQVHYMIKAEKIDLEGNRAKDAFLAHVSHVLRTPLNVVIGYSELLAEVCQERGHTEILPDIKKIRLSGESLLQNINNMLQLTQVEAGKLKVHYDHFRTRGFLEEILNTLSIESKNLTIQLTTDLEDMPEFLETDASKLRQILLHLLSNALKYTNEGEVRFEASTEFRGGREFGVFIVEDTGKGIPEGVIDDLFKDFLERGLLGRPENAGTGLGLAICKSLCEMIGGQIEAHSKWGEGSRFVLKIPVSPGKRLSGFTPHGHGGHYRILLVDDEQPKAEFIKKELESDEWLVEILTPGQEVNDKARQWRPDLILLDGMNYEPRGWLVTQMLKSDPELAHIPIIMVSMLDDVSTTYDLGVMGYLSKPVKESHILKILDRAIPSKTQAPVMIIEDDRVTRRMMRQALERDGWRISEAHDGDVALPVVRKEKPALILLDLIMPNMSGYDFLEKLWEQPELTDIPVMFVSAGHVSRESRLHQPYAIVHYPGDYKDFTFLKNLKQSILEYTHQEIAMKEKAAVHD